MILSNFYKCCQSLIAAADGDTFANVKTLSGNVISAYGNILLNSPWYNTQTLLENRNCYGFSSNYYTSGFLLGSNDAPVTINDFQIAPLNAKLTVTYLQDKSVVNVDKEHHKVTTTRAWSLTNTSTSLSVEVKEIGFAPSTSTSDLVLIWREILGEQSFILQPLQAGTFTMTLEYNLVDYSNPVSSVNFLSEVK